MAEEREERSRRMKIEIRRMDLHKRREWTRNIYGEEKTPGGIRTSK
jgi:hypothetical protein